MHDHVALAILHLPLAVLVLVKLKLSSFPLASKARIILHCSHLCTYFPRRHERKSSLLRKRELYGVIRACALGLILKAQDKGNEGSGTKTRLGIFLIVALLTFLYHGTILVSFRSRCLGLSRKLVGEGARCVTEPIQRLRRRLSG